MLRFVSPCVKLFFLSVHNESFCCRIVFGLPVSFDSTKTSKDPTMLQEAQFQSNTLYSKPFLSLSLVLFCFGFFLYINALLEQNTKLGVSLHFPPDFFPVLWLTDYKQSSNPDPNISLIQAKDDPHAAEVSGEGSGNCCPVPFASPPPF